MIGSEYFDDFSFQIVTQYMQKPNRCKTTAFLTCLPIEYVDIGIDILLFV